MDLFEWMRDSGIFTMSSSAEALPSAGQLFYAPRRRWAARRSVAKFPRKPRGTWARSERTGCRTFFCLHNSTTICRRASATTKGMRYFCRRSRVKRGLSAATWARRRRRIADGTRSSSPFTRMYCSTLRTSKARALLGFTCWKDAPASARRLPRCPPLGRRR